MTKVKICGIRTIDAALVAVSSGADFLGFNFVKNSVRFILPKDAHKIIKLVRGKVKIVGVFQDEDLSVVNRIAKKLKLDFVQLHGQEDKKYMESIPVEIIKSMTLIDDVEKNNKSKYLLLDRSKRGEGDMVDFIQAANLAFNRPIFYAGGLNPNNVELVIKTVQPFGVDVAGGIEKDGIQDLEKIRTFIKNAKGAKL